MSTRAEIRSFMRDTRASFRQVECALSDKRLDDACEFATQAAGCAGEVERLTELYVALHAPSRFTSGDSVNL